MSTEERVVTYQVTLPGTEALWLQGGNGPLAAKKLPGEVTVTPAGAVLDQRAFLSLCHLGCLGVADGRIEYEGDVPELVIGNDRYEVHECEPQDS